MSKIPLLDGISPCLEKICLTASCLLLHSLESIRERILHERSGYDSSMHSYESKPVCKLPTAYNHCRCFISVCRESCCSCKSMRHSPAGLRDLENFLIDIPKSHSKSSEVDWDHYGKQWETKDSLGRLEVRAKPANPLSNIHRHSPPTTTSGAPTEF